jgi:hypothetical protein
MNHRSRAPHRHLDLNSAAEPSPCREWSLVDWRGDTIPPVTVEEGPLGEWHAARTTDPSAPRKRVHEAAYLGCRLQEEIWRHDRYRRSFALVAVLAPDDANTPSEAKQAAGIAQALCALKRPQDVFSWISATTLVLLLPYTGIGDATRERDRLARGLRGVASGWTICVMTYPADIDRVRQLPLDG